MFRIADVQNSGLESQKYISCWILAELENLLRLTFSISC